MRPQQVTNLSLEAFRQVLENNKIFILYPHTNYHNLYLSYFLNEVKEGLLYYRIQKGHSNLHDLICGLIREYRPLAHSFGQHVQPLLENATPDRLGQALAHEFADLNGQQCTVLYLDEFDRMQITDDLQQFIRAFISHFDSHMRLAVSSRLLTYEPWIESVRQGHAAVLGTGHRQNDLIYSTEAEDKPQLEVYAFGRGHVFVNGQPIISWDGALPRHLFFYFMDNPLVTRDEIFDVFWSNLSVKEATNVFHVTKRKITERISQLVDHSGSYELTQFASGFYTQSDKIVRHYDVTDFELFINQGERTLDKQRRAEAYQRAVEIYKGPFLKTIDMPWVVERREKLREMFAGALISLGRIQNAAQDYEAALGYFMRALKELPQREDIYREVMTLYWRLGRHDDAIQHYTLLKKQLEKLLGVAPSQETRSLYEQILAC